LYFPEEHPKKLDQDEIIDILDQSKASKWHEAIVIPKLIFLKSLMKNQIFTSKNLHGDTQRNGGKRKWIITHPERKRFLSKTCFGVKKMWFSRKLR
jgi:hypothetical protein